MPVPPAAAPLYALPPSRFVAARDALARELSGRNDPAAAEVRRLPRPTGLAWVLNRLARERPADVQALLDAAARLRAGQRRALAGEGGAALREAESDLRALARALRGAAAPVLAETGRPAPPQALARVELLLRVAASQPVTREALRDGVLAREPEIATGELSGLSLVDGGGAPAPSRATPAARESRRAPPARPSAPAPEGKAGRAAAAREAKAAQAALARERRAREAAERRAARDLARAEAAAARADREAARAEREAAGAEAAARGAAERARSLREEAALARRRADALRAPRSG